MANDQEKVLAARASMQFVEDGQVVGLGSGSTAAYAVQLLGERVRAGLKIHGIPTSVQTQQLAEELRIPLLALNDVQEIDVTIDGADEIDPELRLIKGAAGRCCGKRLWRLHQGRWWLSRIRASRCHSWGSFPCRSR